MLRKEKGNKQGKNKEGSKEREGARKGRKLEVYKKKMEREGVRTGREERREGKGVSNRRKREREC